MSDSGGAVGTFVAAGVIYWIAVGAASAILLGVVLALALVGLALIGLIVRGQAWFASFRVASARGDTAWQVDIVAMPLVGCVAVSIARFTPLWETRDNVLTNDPIIGILLGCSLLAFLFFGVSFALKAPTLDEPFIRRLGYLAWAGAAVLLTLAFPDLQ